MTYQVTSFRGFNSKWHKRWEKIMSINPKSNERERFRGYIGKDLTKDF